MGKNKAEQAALRAKVLAERAGIKSQNTVAGSIASGASAYFQAEARKEVARQEAEANKVKYQQQTHQVALQQNAGIMHELDKPFLRVELNAGTVRKPMPVSVDLSLLGAYGIANILDAVMQDEAHRAAGNWENADHVAMTWQDARTPRTDKFRYSEPKDTTVEAKTAADAAKIAEAKAKFEELKRLNPILGWLGIG